MALYIVTGGAGFIGSHLTDALIAAGHQVRIVDDLSTGKVDNIHPAASFIEGDVGDLALMRRAMRSASGCFHLAAVASVARGNEAWSECHRINVGGTVAVLEAARDAGRIPVVYASSAAIYGEQPAGPMGEHLMPRPASAYGADKYASELHARIAFDIHGVPTQGFRFFNVYGPRQDPHSPYSGVISIFAGRMAAGQGLVVNGDGLHTRDFISVADIVRFLLAGIKRLRAAPGAHVLNACSGRATSLLEIIDALADVLGHRPAVSHGPARPGDVRVSLGDPRAAAEALGVTARISLREGLERMLVAAPLPLRMAG